MLAEPKHFVELLSPFLKEKLQKAREENDAEVERVLSLQYEVSEEESIYRDGENLRHYDADNKTIFEGSQLHGVERFYQRTMVVEPVLGCAAHCRYCLRKNYDPFKVEKDDLIRIARYIGLAEENLDLREILVTGGDPFLSPSKLETFFEAIRLYAPQIQYLRVATRVPIHQPSRVNQRLLEILARPYPFRIEVATQINHAKELFPEVSDAYRSLVERVHCVYNQGVLLKGLNDSVDALAALYDATRALGVESHYLFHCVPIMGLSSLRVSVDRALELIRELSTSGRISGRTKPMLTLMTDLGKITLYEGAIVGRREGQLLLQTHYRYDERKKWNPFWELPERGRVDERGFLQVWYDDGEN